MIEIGTGMSDSLEECYRKFVGGFGGTYFPVHTKQNFNLQSKNLNQIFDGSWEG